MVVYLLIDKESDEVINIYKYSQVALLAKDRTGLKSAVMNAFKGNGESPYRVEVMKVIE